MTPEQEQKARLVSIERELQSAGLERTLLHPTYLQRLLKEQAELKVKHESA